MGRSSWGRDLPTFSILFPKGRLLFMVLFHSSHFPPAILLSTVLATVLATVRLFPQCLLTWGFLQIFWSLFIFYHTPRPLLSRPRLLCNLLIFYWNFFFTDASPSSHLNPSPSSASLNSWRQKTQRRPSCLKAAIMICILQSYLKAYSPHFQNLRSDQILAT